MQEYITIKIEGQDKKYNVGVVYEDIVKAYQSRHDGMIALVKVNGKITELIKRAWKDCELEFITLADSIGHKTYVRTVTFLMVKAVTDVLKERLEKVKVEFSIGSGYYCSLFGDFIVDKGLAKQVEERMRMYVDTNCLIEKTAYSVEDAMGIFRKQGMKDKVKLFKYRRSSTVNVYSMDGYHDYYYGYMLPAAGYVKYFAVEAYANGLVLMLPNIANPKMVDHFVPSPKFFNTLCNAGEWGEKLGIDTVGDLNNVICQGRIGEVILIQEALQERRIAEIASEIVERGNIKFVMIAGPSSSGKTTFSHRLAVQLSTHGRKPHPIAVDNYFVERDKTPLDEDGNFNFECLEAIDVDQFNSDMSRLLAGESVELPTFDFKKGKREYKGNKTTLGKDDILIIEGIHGLNDRMSHSLPNDSKFKIYISALTSLNIDEHNRIPTTDGRLLRRMVRDARTRGASAQKTIQMWSSVRKGEEENIFPFQESADAMFNSALIYELAVLKQFAEPLLLGIDRGDPEYYEAKRLLKFLDYFLGVNTENLPLNSILREFVGGGCFHL